MASNGRTRIIEGNELIALRSLLTADGTLDSAELNRLSWVLAEIDDKSLFDEDAERIGAAFRATASHFSVVRASDLLSHGESMMGYQFTSSGPGIEEFQGPYWHELNLDDCLLFASPLDGVVLRPGVVATTFIAGRQTFVDTAAGAA